MSSYDGIQQLQRKKRLMEFAGMLKEKKKGNISTLEKIVHRFSIQEGVKPETTWQYADSFCKIGLITYTNGHKRWKYNEDIEWDLFHIEI